MTHLEGPIVDSFYDMSLNSWHKEMKPPLPCLGSPATGVEALSWQRPAREKLAEISHNSEPGAKITKVPPNKQNQDEEENQLRDETVDSTPFNLFETLARQLEDLEKADLPEHTEKDPHYDPDISSEVKRAMSVLSPKGSERKIDAVTRHLSKKRYLVCFSRLTRRRYHNTAKHDR